jgi:hypothetical protein
MLKAMTAVLLAALIVGATSFAPGVSEAIEPPGGHKSLKGDRLPIRAPALDCTQSASPHYDAKCARDRTHPATRAHATRVAAVGGVPFGLS